MGWEWGRGNLAFGYIVPVKQLSTKGLHSQCLGKITGYAVKVSDWTLKLEAGGLDAGRETGRNWRITCFCTGNLFHPLGYEKPFHKRGCFYIILEASPDTFLYCSPHIHQV